MQKPWYQQSEPSICSFFDVVLKTGLTQTEALKRLRHFGNNVDGSLPRGLEKELRVMVLRDGKRQKVPYMQIVPGDVVYLSSGDRVPADLRLFWVDGFTINQSVVTGEPIATLKNTFALAADCEPIKQKNMAFMGTYVVSGSAMGVVVERNEKTVLSQNGHKPRQRRSLKGAVIARRLQRYGVRVLKKQSLVRFRRISHVVIDDTLSDADILDIIRKVQLTRNITCKFVVSEQQAKRLATEMDTSVYDAVRRTDVLHTATFITNVNTDTDNSVHLIKALRAKDATILWVTNGVNTCLALRTADISLVVGRQARADVILAADLYAANVSSTIITRILYNKK